MNADDHFKNIHIFLKSPHLRTTGLYHKMKDPHCKWVKNNNRLLFFKEKVSLNQTFHYSNRADRREARSLMSRSAVRASLHIVANLKEPAGFPAPLFISVGAAEAGGPEFISTCLWMPPYRNGGIGHEHGCLSWKGLPIKARQSVLLQPADPNGRIFDSSEHTWSHSTATYFGFCQLLLNCSDDDQHISHVGHHVAYFPVRWRSGNTSSAGTAHWQPGDTLRAFCWRAVVLRTAHCV